MRLRPLAAGAALAAVLGLVGGCATGPIPEPTPTTRQLGDGSPDRRPALSDRALAALVDPALPGCSAAVGVEGGIAWANAAGLADLATGSPVTVDTRFDMASVTKQFTATVILQLADEGAIALSDTVAAHVAGMPAWAETTTLEQLLHHTSHIRDYYQAIQFDWGLGFADYVSHADMLRAIADLPTLEPGEGFLYSNSNYVLLAEVIQRVTGQTYPEALDARIFAPLGLEMVAGPNLKADDVAVSYDDDLNRQDSGWSGYGAVGIFSTPTQLALWGDQYRAGGLVSPAALEGAVPEPDGTFYAAGIEIQPDGSLAHLGRFGGHITTFRVSADRATTVVVMCNGHSSNREGLFDALWGIWVQAPAAGAA
ncbi:MAG: beta-lactamase family protein [Actinomycetales bacterium]|nr:beta-lactamase family protein [Actinomycetales bacterium]